MVSRADLLASVNWLTALASRRVPREPGATVRCGFCRYPSAREKDAYKPAPGLLYMCPRPQAPGQFAMIPVEGGMVRVPVCEEHQWLRARSVTSGG